MIATEVINANIARHLPLMAAQHPDQIAVVAGAGRDRAGKPIYQRLTFAELEKVSNRYAWGLSGAGFRPGTRVLLLVPAGLPLISLTFALFKIGCVPIMIDPAMGRRNLAQCIDECAPDMMIGVPRGHLAQLIFRKAFRTVRRSVLVGSKFLPFGAVNLADLSVPINTPYPVEPVAAGETAAILFTTGSTGVPKGVIYEHGMFNAQVRLLRDLFKIAEGEVEMPAFPLFALFNVALGVTSAIPPIDPTRPASCDPAEVVEFMRAQGVTSTFGSPAIWERVSRYCIDQNIRLPKLRRVLMAGAPVPAHLHERFRHILSDDADTHTPYGATEALPVASFSGREVLHARAEHPEPTAGTCVGRPVPEMTLRIIAISDEPIADWDAGLGLPPGQIGEICVRGPSVTKAYVARARATQLAKIRDGDAIWHRMGDLGMLDTQGRVWFFGRKSHRVITANGTLFTEPIELIFNRHPHVFRSALVGVPAGDGFQHPVLIVEPRPEHIPRSKAAAQQLFNELRALGQEFSMSAGIRRFLIHPAFPVDIRHNAKIFREQLAVWAAKH